MRKYTYGLGTCDAHHEPPAPAQRPAPKVSAILAMTAFRFFQHIYVATQMEGPQGSGERTDSPRDQWYPSQSQPGLLKALKAMGRVLCSFQGSALPELLREISESLTELLHQTNTYLAYTINTLGDLKNQLLRWPLAGGSPGGSPAI